MNLFLAGCGGPLDYLLEAERGKQMNLYLAESGGLWNAYFKPKNSGGV